MKCKHCGSKKTRKNGKTYGIQRYMCNKCSRTFSPPKYTAEMRKNVLIHYLKGYGVSKTASIAGVSYTTVLNWVKDSSELLEQLRKELGEKPEETDINEK